MQLEELTEQKQTTREKEETARAQSVPSARALAANDLVKCYGRRRVVDGVSLYVEPGEVVGLLGANGAGKTTSFYMIIGLERPDGGRVHLGERDITKLPMYLRARESQTTGSPPRRRMNASAVV